MFWNKKPKKQQAVKPKPKIASPEPKPSQPPPKADVSKRKPSIPITKNDPKKEFLKVFKQLTYRNNPWNVWQDFVTLSACSFSNAVDKSHYDEREALYMNTVKRYNRQEVALFPELLAHTVMALEFNPEQDFLGDIFMELNLGNEHKGQIFTPYCVCRLMAEISVGDIIEQIGKDGYVTINDPCCGAGATLIAGINEAKKKLEKVNINFQNHVLVAAQDIDYTVALMCYIQLSLLGVAAYIKIGNSITEPMCSADTLEDYWFTPMYFSNVWKMRRLFNGGKN